MKKFIKRMKLKIWMRLEKLRKWRSMTKENKIRNIETEIKKALRKYDSGNVDFYRNEENPEIGYLMFHSRHNSFPITDEYFNISELNQEDIKKICDEYNIGYMW